MPAGSAILWANGAAAMLGTANGAAAGRDGVGKKVYIGKLYGIVCISKHIPVRSPLSKEVFDHGGRCSRIA